MSRKRKKRCYCGIGGQAVLEGIMMKNQDKYAVAVRKADGQIELKTEEYKGIWGDKKIAKIPFIRGVFNFIDSMVLGMQTLTWSASFFEEEEPAKKADAQKPEKKQSKAGEKLVMGATVAFSIVLAVAIFVVLPYVISMLFSSYVRNASLLAILEGLLRILIFLGYVVAISAMKDIRRVYMYHGAEHKCINCIERGRELTVKNVGKSSRLHKRCGTSFLLFVMLVSVVLFMFIRVENPVLRLVLRLALVPVIAGISYEIIRLAGRSDNIFVRIISAPGMWLQRLTTKEPDDSMIEVAIAAVEAVFDWKAYLKDTFGYDIDAWEKKEREAEEEEEDTWETQETGGDAEPVSEEEQSAEKRQTAEEMSDAAVKEAQNVETSVKEAQSTETAVREEQAAKTAEGETQDAEEAAKEEQVAETAAEEIQGEETAGQPDPEGEKE